MHKSINDDNGNNRNIISIEKLPLEYSYIGVTEQERGTAQSIICDMQINCSANKFYEVMDYSCLVNSLERLSRSQLYLLEDILSVMCFISFAFKSVEHVDISLTKTRFNTKINWNFSREKWEEINGEYPYLPDYDNQIWNKFCSSAIDCAIKQNANRQSYKGFFKPLQINANDVTYSDG